MPVLNFDDIVTLWNSQGGNPDMANLMAGIALAESGGDTTSLFNNGTTDYSVGLWQINYFGSLMADRTAKYGTPQSLQASPPAQALAAIDISGNNFAGVHQPWFGDPVTVAWENAGSPTTVTKAQVQGWLSAANRSTGGGSSAGSSALAGSSGVASAGSSGSPGGTIVAPPAGLVSDVGKDQFVLNGSRLTIDLSNALVNASVTYDATQASVIELVLKDADANLIGNDDVLQQKSVLNLDGSLWQMAAVSKSGTDLTCTFEPWVVAALRSATGPFAVSPGTLARTGFAQKLVEQVQGATFVSPPFLWLYNQNKGYAHTSYEQLSRGHIQNPEEDSWTCLQRLASEIQWRCFEFNGAVYFGPDEWLIGLPVATTLQQWTNGVSTIDGDYDMGQPLSEATVTAVVGSWVPTPGQSVAIANLGPFSLQPWLVVKVNRPNLFQPDVTLTLQVPQPDLPEPASGGASAFVNTGATALPSTAGRNVVSPAGTGITLGRVDQGVDFGGSGPLLAVGSGKIVLAGYDVNGWGPPGGGEAPGGVVLLVLDNPPDSQHNTVYYAEGLDPSVTAGQTVKAGDVVALANGNSVEIGWADPNSPGSVVPLNQITQGRYSGSGATPEGQKFYNYITTGSL